MPEAMPGQTVGSAPWRAKYDGPRLDAKARPQQVKNRLLVAQFSVAPLSRVWKAEGGREIFAQQSESDDLRAH